MRGQSKPLAAGGAQLSRRLMLGALTAAPAALGLALAQTNRLPLPRDVRAPGQPCPPDAGIVNWIPDVLHPVSHGVREYAAGESGAPFRVRIYYPSHQPFTEGGNPVRPLLKLCAVRWPLVLFLHGLPPCIEDVVNDPNYYLRWTKFATVLAKSGYVVAVPSYEPPEPTDANHPTIARMMNLINWVRGTRIDTSHPGAARIIGPLPQSWENAAWVHASATAIVGHSFGALLAARIARVRPSISSYVSLSGGFDFSGDPVALLQNIPARKFFMWAATIEGSDLTHENLDQSGLWARIPQAKHVAVRLPGEHFDYVRLRDAFECGAIRSTCTPLQDLAPDLAALFIARHTPVGAAPGIPLSLIPPDVTLTPTQRFFVGNHLSGLALFNSERNCRMSLRWETPEGSGAR